MSTRSSNARASGHKPKKPIKKAKKMTYVDIDDMELNPRASKKKALRK